MTVNYNELSKQIVSLDCQVRFAGIANSKGKLVAEGHGKCRENIGK